MSNSDIIKNVTTRFETKSSQLIDYNVPSMYVTYYNLSKENTVLDSNFISTYQTIGGKSGHQWNKFVNIPLYFGEQVQPQFIIDEKEGVKVKLLSNIVIPQRYIDEIEVSVGDAVYFSSVPADYKQRLFFVANIEYASINTVDSIKLTLTPHGGHTIKEIENQISSSKTFDMTAKSLIDSDQYKKIENIEKHLQTSLRIINDRTKESTVPWLYSANGNRLYLTDVFTTINRHISPLKPRNYNLRYSLVMEHDLVENADTSMFELLFNPCFPTDKTFTWKYNGCQLSPETNYYRSVLCNIDPDTYELSRITGSLEGTDLIMTLYQFNATYVLKALVEFQNFRRGDHVEFENINTDKTFLNQMIFDYLCFKLDPKHPFPEIDKYKLNNGNNTLELMFFVKFMFELLAR